MFQIKCTNSVHTVRKVLVLAVICMLFFNNRFYVNAATDSDFSSAKAMTWGTTYEGNISNSNTIDFYSLSLSKSGCVKIQSMADMKELGYSVYDEAGNKLWSITGKRHDKLGVISETHELQLTKGKYYLSVERSNANNGEYNIFSTFVSANEDFAEEGSGSNNTMDTADVITLSREYDGQIAINDTVDYYKFVLDQSGQLDIEIEWTSGYILYRVVDTDETEIWYNSNRLDGGCWGEGNSSHSMHLTEGTYYFRVKGDKDEAGLYNFKTSFSATKESFTENYTDKNNNTILKADRIELGKLYRGQIANNDKTDFYQFDIPKKMTVYITASGERPESYGIYDKVGNAIKEVSSYSEFEYKVVLDAGTYYFRAYGPYNYNTGDYTFKIAEYKLDTPSIKKISNSSSGVKLSWGKINLATGYKVWRKVGSGSYKVVKTITDASTVSYTDKDVKSGNKYSYKIQAYNSDLNSKESTVKTIKYLSQPTITLSNTSKGVYVKWSKVTGASGYKVYRKTSSSASWKLYKTITKNSTTTFTNTSVKNGNTYYYTVSAYYGDTTSSYSSSGKKLYRLSPTSITSLKNNSAKKMTVKWKKNSKASGYQVQYATKSSFSNAKKKTYSGASAVSKTISSLTKTKKYYVRVRSYKKVNGTTYYSSWSPVKSVKISK